MTLRSVITVAMAAAIVAGCNPGTTATGSPDPPTAAPSATAATETTAPTSLIESPEPTAGVVCPSDLPTELASVDELADPSCYGSTELSIDGWLSEIDVHIGDGEPTPSWTIALSGLFARSATVGEAIFDYLMRDRRPAASISVVTPPESGIDLLGLGRWVTLRGRFNDAAASACTILNWEPDPEDANQDPPDLECERLFVVSGLTTLERPVPDCPMESPMTLAEFEAADFMCRVGQEVRIAGWEDPGEGFGGASDVYPISFGTLKFLDEAQLVANRWESDDVEHVIFPWTVRGSGVSFDDEDLRVVVTGTLGHAASEGCRPALEGWTWTPPASWVQNRCMRLFVITDVRVRS